MKILAATDGSEGAQRALDRAAELAESLKAELLVVNVLDGVPDSLFRRFTPEENSWLLETENAVSAEILSEAASRARYHGCHNVMLDSASGDVAAVILKIAQQSGADIIVVGKRGASPIKGLLLGSVSQKLVSLAPCPVLVIP